MSAIVAIPHVVVELEGAQLADNALRTLTRVLVQQRLSVPTLCELTFEDPAGAIAQAYAPGSSLLVRLEGYTEPLFSGEITAVEYVYGPRHEREIRVRSYDSLHRLRKRQPVRAHVQVGLLDLCSEIAADLGLSVESMDDGPIWQHVIQHRQSDLDLLVELAEQCGLYLTVRGTILHLVTLSGLGTPVPLDLGDSLLEARLEVNADPACRSVLANGWDASRAERHRATVTETKLGREVTAEVAPDRVGGSGQRNLVDQSAFTDRHAAGLAQSELDWHTAREVSFWGVAQGDPGLQPARPVEIRGVEAALTGRYVITSATHRVDRENGFTSEISTTPPARRGRRSAAVAALGAVSRIDDPDGLGRVRVSLPTYEDVETDWMCVLLPAAGKGKGFVSLPDVGDQVLVLFAHEDPSQGVVLGGLYGVQKPPDTGIENGAVARYTLLTPGGQQAQLDDTRKAVHLANSDGSFVDISPEKIVVHAKTDLFLEAPGRLVVIQGDKIDFRRA